MKTIEITLYKFSELSSEAQETAINKEKEHAYENIELDFFADDCKEIAAENGFLDAKLMYSLGYSQGDGLSFTADIDLSKFIKDFNPEMKTSVSDALYNNIDASCKANNGHYAYASDNDIKVEFVNYAREYNNLNDLTEKLQDFIIEKYRSLCAEFEKNGYADIEYQSGEEAAREKLNAEEYEFTEDGEIY